MGLTSYQVLGVDDKFEFTLMLDTLMIIKLAENYTGQLLNDERIYFPIHPDHLTFDTLFSPLEDFLDYCNIGSIHDVDTDCRKIELNVIQTLTSQKANMCLSHLNRFERILESFANCIDIVRDNEYFDIRGGLMEDSYELFIQVVAGYFSWGPLCKELINIVSDGEVLLKEIGGLIDENSRDNGKPTTNYNQSV